MKAFNVNIIGLSLKTHLFDFSLDDAFFGKYGTEMLLGGDFEVKVVLNKHETFIETDFEIVGNAKLVCDRSLETFEHPLKSHRKVVFKYGEEPREVSDEITVISRDQATLDLGQLMYEFIVVALPMKKLHPRFREEEKDEDQTEGKIVYRSSTDDEQAIDPRWEALKKLNK